MPTPPLDKTTAQAQILAQRERLLTVAMTNIWERTDIRPDNAKRIAQHTVELVDETLKAAIESQDAFLTSIDKALEQTLSAESLPLKKIPRNTPSASRGTCD